MNYFKFLILFCKEKKILKFRNLETKLIFNFGVNYGDLD